MRTAAARAAAARAGAGASGLPAEVGRRSLLARLVLGTTSDPSDPPDHALGAAAPVAVHRPARRRARQFDAPKGKPGGR